MSSRRSQRPVRYWETGPADANRNFIPCDYNYCGTLSCIDLQLREGYREDSLESKEEHRGIYDSSLLNDGNCTSGFQRLFLTASRRKWLEFV